MFSLHECISLDTPFYIVQCCIFPKLAVHRIVARLKEIYRSTSWSGKSREYGSARTLDVRDCSSNYNLQLSKLADFIYTLNETMILLLLSTTSMVPPPTTLNSSLPVIWTIACSIKSERNAISF